MSCDEVVESGRVRRAGRSSLRGHEEEGLAGEGEEEGASRYKKCLERLMTGALHVGLVGMLAGYVWWHLIGQIAARFTGTKPQRQTSAGDTPSSYAWRCRGEAQH